MIDGPNSVGPAGQDGEFRLSGTASFVSVSKSVKTFYDGADGSSQNPSSYPNWYYYWEQTSADYGTLYRHTGWAHAAYESGEWRAYLGPYENDSYQVPEGDNGGNVLEYIDNFAWTARHEGRHVTTFTNWWPSGHGIWMTPDDWTNDGDQDYLPDTQEAALGGTPASPINGGYFDPTKYNTDYPNDPFPDCQDYTCNTQAPWTQYSAKDDDWAHPGSQWP